MTETCSLPDVVAFVEGTMNGEPYTERHIDEMVANYGRLRGYWSPYVSIDHERGAYSALAFGDVVGARKGRVKLTPGGGWVRTADTDRSPGTRAALVTTSRDVPREVGDLIKTRRLPRVSIEMFDGTFNGPTGLVPTKVLKSVSLLGARSEASKGMPPPSVHFADRTGRPVPPPPRSTGPAKCFGDTPVDPLLTDPPAVAPTSSRPRCPRATHPDVRRQGDRHQPDHRGRAGRAVAGDGRPADRLAAAGRAGDRRERGRHPRREGVQ
jgi:hypothetical protein